MIFFWLNKWGYVDILQHLVVLWAPETSACLTIDAFAPLVTSWFFQTVVYVREIIKILNQGHIYLQLSCICIHFCCWKRHKRLETTRPRFRRLNCQWILFPLILNVKSDAEAEIRHDVQSNVNMKIKICYCNSNKHLWVYNHIGAREKCSEHSQLRPMATQLQDWKVNKNEFEWVEYLWLKLNQIFYVARSVRETCGGLDQKKVECRAAIFSIKVLICQQTLATQQNLHPQVIKARPPVLF